MTTSPLSPAAAIRQQIDVLATAIVTRQYARQAQVWQPYGAPGQSKSVRDARYHLEYLAKPWTRTRLNSSPPTWPG